MKKDTIYVVQNNSINDDYRVVYAGRSSSKACEVAAKFVSVRISLHAPEATKERPQND